MLNEKKVSKAGSITVPSYLRRELGLQPGEKIKIEPDQEGNITLKRIEGSCICCKTSDHLMKVQGLYICKDCAELVAEHYEKKIKA